MPERKKPPPPSTSRTVAVIAVVVLIVVAIAGIVLASRQSGEEGAPAVAAAASAAAAPLPVTTLPAASAPTAPIDNTLVFAAGSDKLPRDANEKIARVAEAARAGASAVRITARFLTGANKARDQELAKNRAGAVHHALTADGMTGDRLQIELVEMPAGSLTEDASNRVEMAVR